MTGFNHVLTGVSIAIIVKNPVLAPILAFVSHFILDSVPHFGHPSIDPGSKEFVFRRLIIFLIIDATLCFSTLFVALALFPSLALTILLACFFAALPDFLWVVHYAYGLKNRFFTFAKRIQWFEKPTGLFVEVPFAILQIAFLISQI